MLLARLFERIITNGRLRVIDAGGTSHDFAGAPGRVRRSGCTTRRCIGSSSSGRASICPEAYVDGTLTIEEGSLYDLIDLLQLNLEAMPEGVLSRLLNGSYTLLRRVHQYNPLSRARQNVAHHYDLSDQLYELFLDRDRQYSCAYFRGEDEDLEQAQLDKKRHIAAKLMIEPGQKVLDIGSGWGGLALYLAGECGADVTGLTLSVEQHKVATRRAAAAGLSDRVRFHLRDYREEDGQYDRIVSVGMFEHVGVNHYAAFFAKLKSLLGAGRGGAAALDRPHGRAGLDSTLDPQIHLSRRLCAGSVRGRAGGRAAAAVDHRHRDPAAALRPHPARLAAALRAESRPHQGDLRRALLPDVGDVSRRLGNRVPARRAHGVPDAARQGGRRGAARPRLHARWERERSAAAERAA